ncbi:MAG TPA: hydantoinase/oxoprolinase N-terminal domain-containing protein, partial [Acidimicrobiia bacterium]|nr:hydantoinase/oxoprolinase N-terminal domain-containing protein [Acidimicrobiia bacterium]
MSREGAVVGVDIGGTFTDVALLDAEGRLTVGKQATTPEDPRVGVVEALRRVLGDAGVDAGAVTRVVHGTTLATNVVVERRGGPVALVTTEGFGDLLALGRQARVEDDRYDLGYTPPAPLVPAALTYEVPERVGAHGEVLVPLEDAAVEEVVRALADARPTGVAVCLLHSYAVPEHERRVAAACRAALPEAFVVASCEVWPELREYERAMTTVVCALVGPIMASYLAGLEEQL